ncbi:MAG TPA: hypothetical protein VG167_17100 [Verrucomicrobiae bacterium]|nr:hypothetical protein [Verrucomicrobiae bacterium]
MENALKTSFLSKHDLGDGFRRDMKVVLGLNPDVVARLPEFAFRATLTPTTREKDKIYQKASSELGIPLVQIEPALNVSAFLLRQLTPGGEASADDEQALLADLKEALPCEDDKSQILTRYLEGLKKFAKQDLRVAILQRAHEQSALPILNEVSVEADFRAVFENSYHYEEDIAAYSPKFLGTIPLGIVRLEFDGTQDDAYFQLSKRSLQVLIDSLVALQKEIQVAEKSISAAQPKQ